MPSPPSRTLREALHWPPSGEAIGFAVFTIVLVAPLLAFLWFPALYLFPIARILWLVFIGWPREARGAPPVFQLPNVRLHEGFYDQD